MKKWNNLSSAEICPFNLYNFPVKNIASENIDVHANVVEFSWETAKSRANPARLTISLTESENSGDNSTTEGTIVPKENSLELVHENGSASEEPDPHKKTLGQERFWNDDFTKWRFQNSWKFQAIK